MFMQPGTLYVYQIYGIYFCLNISSQGKHGGGGGGLQARLTSSQLRHLGAAAEGLSLSQWLTLSPTPLSWGQQQQEGQII